MPIFFECQRCTACCRWPGQVRLTDTEITRMAGFLGVSELAFIQDYTRVNRARTGLALKDQEDGACIFLEGQNCRVQPVKPQQCRDFPNLWNFPGFQDLCSALPRVVSEEDYRDRILKSTGRDPVT